MSSLLQNTMERARKQKATSRNKHIRAIKHQAPCIYIRMASFYTLSLCGLCSIFFFFLKQIFNCIQDQDSSTHYRLQHLDHSFWLPGRFSQFVPLIWPVDPTQNIFKVKLGMVLGAKLQVNSQPNPTSFHSSPSSSFQSI